MHIFFPLCPRSHSQLFLFFNLSLSPSSPGTHVLVTAASSPVPSLKIILRHLFSFETLLWRSFSHLVALTASHFHVFHLWLPLLHASVLSAETFFFSWLISNSNIISHSTEMYLYSTLTATFPPEFLYLKIKPTYFLFHWHAEKSHTLLKSSPKSLPCCSAEDRPHSWFWSPTDTDMPNRV